jgi:hypothetical protein
MRPPWPKLQSRYWVLSNQRFSGSAQFYKECHIDQLHQDWLNLIGVNLILKYRLSSPIGESYALASSEIDIAWRTP